MKLTELIVELEAIRRVHGDDVPIYVSDSRNGVTDELRGGPYLRFVTGDEMAGDIIDETPGTLYVYFVTG